MKNSILLLFTITLALTSCATITTKKRYNLTVLSDVPNARVQVNDSIYTLPSKVTVTRSKSDLALRLITDSVTKDYTVKASPSAAFIYGNLFFMQAFPVGHLVDYTNQKRFYYGHKVRLNANDTITTITPRLAKGYINYFSKQFPTSKGQVKVTGSLMFASLNYVQPRNEELVNMVTMGGVSLGLEYYYNDHKFIKLYAGYAPGAQFYESFDAYETVKAANFTLTDNFKFNRFTFGYGLNYAIYTWQLVNDDYEFPRIASPGEVLYPIDLREPEKKHNHSVGLNLNVYNQFTKGLFIGINYNPTFYSISPDSRSLYQHTINLDIMYKLKL